MTMKPIAALWRLGLAIALSVVLFILLSNTLVNPVAVDTRSYSAEFTDASGLHPDGDVRVRGVRVGKVQSVDLARRDGQNVAEVKFTLDQKYGVVDATRMAIKFQALTGVRYMDVTNPAEGYRAADLVTQIPTSMTQPSFDVTQLFNGLQPVLAILSPDEINNFTANAASFLTGDGSGLAPLLDSIRRLTEFVSDRQQVVATLLSNLSGVADAIGGTSAKFIRMVDLANQPVDAALTILDEFRKEFVYSKDFFDPAVRLLHNAGLRNGVNIDDAFDRAFSNLDNFFDAFKLVPVINENIPPPGNDGTAVEPCSRGNFQLPETMDVLLNGQRVVAMQSLKSVKFLRSPVAWGVAAMVFALVVALAVAYIYYNTPGKSKILSFYTDDANSIRTGDSVRMAGVTVGTVTDLALESNQVKVTAKIDDDAFVGDQSQVDVRMLTVVGGYYVSVASIGEAPLGGQTIPLSRVTMPYSLIRALTDTTKITDNVNPKPVNESLNQISQGLTGTNVQVVATAIDAGNALMSTVERQRGQVTKILGLSDEYIRALANYRDKFAQLVRKVSIVTQTLVVYNQGLSNTIVGISDVLMALKPLGDFYENHRVDFIERVREFLDRGRLFTERNGLTIRLLKRVQNLFDRVLDAQNAEPGLLATDLCMPTPGSPC